mmetsp:Transcript_72881/g.189240  ORF Transcript_72881/g.189240 Transcript_72881/m.189240 type:complete len:280 (+) Transcript_72881:851-1690(+)
MRIFRDFACMFVIRAVQGVHCSRGLVGACLSVLLADQDLVGVCVEFHLDTCNFSMPGQDIQVHLWPQIHDVHTSAFTLKTIEGEEGLLPLTLGCEVLGCDGDMFRSIGDIDLRLHALLNGGADCLDVLCLDCLVQARAGRVLVMEGHGWCAAVLQPLHDSALLFLFHLQALENLVHLIELFIALRRQDLHLAISRSDCCLHLPYVVFLQCLLHLLLEQERDALAHLDKHFVLDGPLGTVILVPRAGLHVDRPKVVDRAHLQLHGNLIQAPLFPRPIRPS